ncbi:hypothetical protein [Nocardiopsis nanhaiensis]
MFGTALLLVLLGGALVLMWAQIPKEREETRRNLQSFAVVSFGLAWLFIVLSLFFEY